MHHRFSSFLGLALLFGTSCAVFPGVGDEIREPKWIFLFAGSALLVVKNVRFSLTTLRSLSRDYPWLVFFAGLCLHALLRPNGWAPPLFIAGFFLLWIATADLRCRMAREDGRRLLRVGAALTLGNALLAVLQVLAIDPIFGVTDPAFFRSPVGLLGNHTIFGAWMAMMAAWHLARAEWKLFALAAFCVLLSGSAFSLVSLVAVLALWAFVKTSRKKTLLAAGGFFASILLFTVTTASPDGFFFENGRFLIWRHTLLAIQENPWFGYGLLSFSSLFPRYHQGYVGVRFLQAHNELLQWTYETGTFGLAIISPLMGNLATGILRSWKDPARLPALLVFTALTVNAFGNFTLHIAPLALGWLLAVHDLRVSPSGDVNSL